MSSRRLALWWRHTIGQAEIASTAADPPMPDLAQPASSPRSDANLNADAEAHINADAEADADAQGQALQSQERRRQALQQEFQQDDSFSQVFVVLTVGAALIATMGLLANKIGRAHV